MALAYTTVIGADGDPRTCSCGNNDSIQEYHGFCEVCWLELSQQERAALSGVEVPEVTLNAKVAAPITFTGVIWKLLVTGTVAYLVYRDQLFETVAVPHVRHAFEAVVSYLKHL